MASIKKVKSGYQVRIKVNGHRPTKTFKTRAEANAWAAATENELRNLSGGVSLTHTVADVFKKYQEEISPDKKGARWEIVRLDLFLRDKKLVDIKLVDLSPDHIGQWIQRRMKDELGPDGEVIKKGVTGSTVNRELNLMSNAFTIAAKQWRWMKESPTKDVRRPKESPPRDRLITDEEAELISQTLGFDGNKLDTVGSRVGAAFMFALQTGMRAGEIASLVKGNVTGRVAHLEMTKNGTSRDVPLSKEAKRLWDLTNGEGFDLTSRQISANFAKYSKLAGVKNVTFHDSRHRAVTDLAKKLDILALAKMIGHRDLKQLQTYYDRPAEDIAGDLDD